MKKKLSIKLLEVIRKPGQHSMFQLVIKIIRTCDLIIAYLVQCFFFPYHICSSVRSCK